MQTPPPPKLAAWLLCQFTAEEALIGDLIERYHEGRSEVWFWKQVLWTIAIGGPFEAALHERGPPASRPARHPYPSVFAASFAACSACFSLRAMFRVCHDFDSVFGFGFSFLCDSRLDGVVVDAMYPSFSVICQTHVSEFPIVEDYAVAGCDVSSS